MTSTSVFSHQSSTGQTRFKDVLSKLSVGQALPAWTQREYDDLVSRATPQPSVVSDGTDLVSDVQEPQEPTRQSETGIVPDTLQISVDGQTYYIPLTPKAAGSLGAENTLQHPAQHLILKGTDGWSKLIGNSDRLEVSVDNPGRAALTELCEALRKERGTSNESVEASGQDTTKAQSKGTKEVIASIASNGDLVRGTSSAPMREVVANSMADEVVPVATHRGPANFPVYKPSAEAADSEAKCGQDHPRAVEHEYWPDSANAQIKRLRAIAVRSRDLNDFVMRADLHPGILEEPEEPAPDKLQFTHWEALATFNRRGELMRGRQADAWQTDHDVHMHRT